MSVPSKSELKIPTFNTRFVRPSPLTVNCSNTVSNDQTTTITTQCQRAMLPSTAVDIRKSRSLSAPRILHVNGVLENSDNAKTSQSVTKNISTTRISVGGKMIDIDVLTKLQQHQRGNIVSFTASKEFLSNLANAKSNHISAKSNNVANKLPIPKSIVVNGAKMTSQVTVGGNVNKPIVRVVSGKTCPGKFLLPKSTSSPLTKVYPVHASPVITRCAVEVKKFVPEINGLSTALKTITTCSKLIDDTVNHNKISVTPMSLDMSTCVKGSNVHKPTLLIQGDVNQFTTSQVALNTIPFVSTSSNIKYSEVQPTTKQRDMTNQNNNNTNTTRKIKPKSSYEKTTATSMIRQSSFVDGNQKNHHHYHRASNYHQNPIASADVSTFKIQKLLHHKNFTKTAHNSSATTAATTMTTTDSRYHQRKQNIEKTGNAADKGGKKISGFDELYNAAVKNVLNIQTFPDKLTSRNHDNEIRQEFEEEFKRYLETPMDIERKINDGVFTFSRKKRFKYESDEIGEPKTKKIKVNVSPDSTPPSLKVGIKRKIVTSLHSNDAPLKTDDVENRKFFSQFLCDQSAMLHKPITHEYYSPIDFPWFYPSYYYPGYFVMPHPPMHTPTTALSTTPSTDLTPEVTTSNRIKTEENSLPSKKAPVSNPLRDSPCEVSRTKKTRLKSSMTKSNKKPKGRQDVTGNPKIVDLPGQRVDGKSLKRSLRLKESLNRKTMTSPPSTTTTTITTTTTTTDSSKPPKLVANGSVKRLAPNTLNNTSKKLKQNNNVKFRYSVRQRLKALKKANKQMISSAQQQEQQQKPKYVLKKLDKKTSTKKELFLACLGLRRILKHI